MALYLFHKHLANSAVAALLVTTLAACGAGTEEESAGNLSDLYDGNVSEATLTPNNADDLSTDVYTGGEASESIGGGVLRSAAAGGDHSSRTLKIIQFAQDTIDSLGLSDPTRSLTRNEVSETEQFEGSCGGGATLSITFDDETGEFGGSITFDDFCEDNEITSGEIMFSGTLDPDTVEFDSFTMVFDSLTVTSNNESFTTTGELAVSSTGSTTHTEMDIIFEDNLTGQAVWFENFTIDTTASEIGGFTEISIAGRYYDWVHGFVTVTTVSPLRVMGSDEWPSAGEYILEGDSSSAHIEVLSNTTFQLSVDEDGDGNYDYTEALLWEDFEA